MNDDMSPSVAEFHRLIVLGAEGFIGSAVCGYFRHLGIPVLGTVFARPPREDEITLDVTGTEEFFRLPPGVPVVNATGILDQRAPPALMRRVHVGGMSNIIGWGRNTGCPHIIQLSSVSVYGNATVGVGRREKTTRRRTVNPLLASLPYGRTKARAEKMLEKSGLSYSAPRLPAVYGPGDGFLTPQIRRLLREPGRPLPPAGSHPISLMPVDQVGPLVKILLEHGPLNAALNAAAAHVPWRDILDAYRDAWNLNPNCARRARLRDYLAFSDPGLQMAVYYGRFGAEFPDDELRSRTGWRPEGDWRRTVTEAARALERISEKARAS
ncbi:MAG: NAD(P)-dependent oxidoreductase [Spirochaetaceae bacterium]|nr:NAD(P)-dependent oxidoreductase [Spirochaetaceae bacterium]